jgi:hypothetical protein
MPSVVPAFLYEQRQIASMFLTETVPTLSIIIIATVVLYWLKGLRLSGTLTSGGDNYQLEGLRIRKPVSMLNMFIKWYDWVNRIHRTGHGHTATIWRDAMVMESVYR